MRSYHRDFHNARAGAEHGQVCAAARDANAATKQIRARVMNFISPHGRCGAGWHPAAG